MSSLSLEAAKAGMASHVVEVKSLSYFTVNFFLLNGILCDTISDAVVRPTRLLNADMLNELLPIAFFYVFKLVTVVSYWTCT